MAYQYISGRLASTASSSCEQQRCGDRPPLIERNPLQGGGQVQPHERRGLGHAPGEPASSGLCRKAASTRRPARWPRRRRCRPARATSAASSRFSSSSSPVTCSVHRARRLIVCSAMPGAASVGPAAAGHVLQPLDRRRVELRVAARSCRMRRACRACQSLACICRLTRSRSASLFKSPRTRRNATEGVPYSAGASPATDR